MWKDSNIYGLMDRVLIYCSRPQLKKIKQRCNALMKEMQVPPNEASCRNFGLRTLALSKAVRNKRFQVEWRYCNKAGKGCQGCPHGPYIYVYWHEGGTVQEAYLGRKVSRLPPSLRSEFHSVMSFYKRPRVSARHLRLRAL